LGKKKCSANPPPTRTLGLGLVLCSNAPSTKNDIGRVQTQTAALDQRLPIKMPNKTAIVRLNNHSRSSIPETECARPIRDHADHKGDSTTDVPKVAMARFNTNAPRNRSTLKTCESFCGILRSLAEVFVTIMFRRRSSSARIGRASSTRASASAASAISSSSLLDK